VIDHGHAELFPRPRQRVGIATLACEEERAKLA